jgi:Ca-activated chloride channel homolog
MTPLEFGFPWALFLLPTGFLLVWISRGSARAGGASLWRVLSPGARLGMFLCLVLALGDPRAGCSSHAPHVVLAVDVSTSVGTDALEAAKSFVRRAGLPHGERTWLLFAGGTRILHGELPEEASGAGDPDATDIGKALQVASAIFPPGTSRSLVLFSDGVGTTGDAAAGIASLASAGVTASVVPIHPPDRPEVLVQNVSAPREVRVNEPFEVTATVAANRPASARMDVFQDGVRAGSRDVSLRPGDNALAITQRLASGRAVKISVTVSASPDTLEANNTGSTIVMVRGEAPVLLVSENPSPELARALAPQGIALETRPAAGVPEDLAGLLAFDAVILDQVPAERLAGARERAIARFVKDHGGGLLMLGGPDSFGAGGYGESEIGDLLPLMSSHEKRVEIPSLALVPVIDRSGSMAGQKIRMAKAAAAGAVGLLAPRDYAGVVVFDNEATWAPRISTAANRPEILREIDRIEDGGGTNIAAALETALEGLRACPAKIKHAILLSDGISIPGPMEDVAARMAAENITLTTVALGRDADAPLLERMARIGGGRFYFTSSPEAVPQIFARETLMAARPDILEEPFAVSVVNPAPFLAGMDFASAPPLLGRVLTEARPGATIWLAAGSGDPLLATWRTGLGRVAAFASDARNVWASEWTGWERFGAFWAQVLREIMRPRDLRSFPVRMVREAGGLRLTVEAADAAGRPLAGISGTALVEAQGGEAFRQPLEPAGPGLLEAWWPSPPTGTTHALVELTTPEGPVTQYAGSSTDFPAELLMPPVNRTLLESLATQTGGSLDPAPAAIRQGSPQSISLELWPWLAALCLPLFLADVWLRKRAPGRPEAPHAATPQINPPPA